MSQGREIFEMHDEIEALRERIAELEKELEELRGDERYVPVERKCTDHDCELSVIVGSHNYCRLCFVEK